MKRFWLAVVVANLGTLAFAGAPPIYPSQVDGTVVAGIFERRGVSVELGTPEECTSRTTSFAISYDCQLSGAKATFTSGSSSKVVTLTGAFVDYRQLRDKTRRTYTLYGKYSEETEATQLADVVSVSLIHYDTDAKNFTGLVKFNNLNVQESLVAKLKD